MTILLLQHTTNKKNDLRWEEISELKLLNSFELIHKMGLRNR
jgi:hypothetical protein